MNSNISRKLIDFINKRSISYRTIQYRTGMSLANIKQFKNDPDYGLTLSWLTRLLAGFRKERMAESIFDDWPDLQDYIFTQPKAWNILTEEDLLKFDILMRDFLLKDGESYYKLLDLFYVLKTMCANTKKSKTDPSIVSFKDVHEKRSRYLGEISFLEDDLSGFFTPNPEQNFAPNDYSNTNANYPKREFDEFTDMLENGEAITWADVSAFMTMMRVQSGKSAELLDIKLGLPSRLISRIETQRTKTIHVDDILKIDDYLNLDGGFAAMCIRATQNNIIAAGIMNEVDNILFDPDADPNGIEKTARNNQFDKATDSFICMVRYIQNLNRFTGFFNSFISSFRNQYSCTDEENEKLNLYAESYFRYISSTDLLKYYRFPKF